MSKDQTGPAFPVPESCGRDAGMTLRQWYAGQAAIGIIAGEGEYMEAPNDVAERAFRIADAMIEESKK